MQRVRLTLAYRGGERLRFTSRGSVRSCRRGIVGDVGSALGDGFALGGFALSGDRGRVGRCGGGSGWCDFRW